MIENHLFQVLDAAGDGPVQRLARRRGARGEGALPARRAHARAARTSCAASTAATARADGVDPQSTVETFAALRLNVDSWRWADVPILVRAGKCLPVKATEIVVELKRPPERLFPMQHAHGNRVRFQIDPDVAIGIEVQARRPDTEDFEVEDVELVAMRETAHQVPPYQRLLTAALEGEHGLFASWATIEEAWRIVDPVLGDVTPVHPYEPGSWGPGAGRRAHRSRAAGTRPAYPGSTISIPQTTQRR